MKRSNTPAEPGKPRGKPKKHPLGTSILDTFYCVEDQRQYFSDGFRTLGLVHGGKS